MNNRQLTQLANKCLDLRRIFQGVFPSDKLPRNIKHKKGALAYIVNLDREGQPGSHWVAIFVPANRKLPMEYFDSYGLLPFVSSVVNFVASNDFVYNNVTLQAPLSSTCGQYALFYICLRARNYSSKTILKMFKQDDPFYNDQFVNNSIEKLFDVSLDVYDVEFLGKQIAISFQPFLFKQLSGMYTCLFE